MVVLEKEFGTDGSLYREAWDIFRSVADLEDIGADDNTTLVVETRAEGNMADTYLLINGVDTDATVPQEWCNEGVQNALVTIQIRVTEVATGVGGSTDRNARLAQVLETLAHEWGLHGEKAYRFVKGMRTDDTADDVRDRYVEMDMTAGSAVALPEHRALAEGTHALHRQLMLALRDARPALADLLLAAWQADVHMYAASARDGHLATATWAVPVAATAVAEVESEDDELAAFKPSDDPGLEDWLNEPSSKSVAGDDKGASEKG